MERSSLRDLLRVSKDLEEKTRSNEGLAFNLLHLGEELQQTVNNMKTVSLNPYLVRSRFLAISHAHVLFSAFFNA